MYFFYESSILNGEGVLKENSKVKRSSRFFPEKNELFKIT